jgi:hypothetical protein
MMTKTERIEDRLRLCAEDPMWADHAEVSKRLLFMAAKEMARLRTIESAYNLLIDQEISKDLSKK